MKKSTLATTFFLLTSLGVPLFASATEWKIVNEKSKIDFKATQNDSIISGSFKKFEGEINFDPAQLKTSKVTIKIDTSSLESSLADATSTLKAVEWLSVKSFPKANFVAEKFTKVSDKKFTALGILMIKGVAIPTTLNFTLEEYSAAKAHALGTVSIRRSDFNIGPKDPANAHGVKDEVVVNFVVDAVK